jgi:hypothetical protein
MAALRYARDKPAPPMVSKLHGYLASAGMALLLYGWASMHLPRIAVMATVLLLVAATGGLAMGQAWRWKRAPPVEMLLFGHMALAAMGYILLLGASMAAA